MLEELFQCGYIDVNKLILDFYKDLGLSSNDVIVLLKILEYIKSSKRIRINKLALDTSLSKSDVETSLGNLTDKRLYGSIITTNEDGVADERPTIKPLFDKLEDFIKKNQILRVENDLLEIVNLYEEGTNKQITPIEYNRFESFVNEGFLPSEIKDAVKATIKKKNVNINAVERILIKNHHQMLDDNEERVDPKKTADLKKALSMLK